MKKIIIILLFFTSTLLIAQNSIDSIKVKEFKLKNGLTVILNEDHTKPEVFGCVVAKAGAKDDPKDATGMAHYQEHMLFKGTQDFGTTNWEKEKVHIDKIFNMYDELGQTTDEEKRKEIQTKINEESLEAGKYIIPNELSNVVRSIGGTNLNASTGWDYTIYYNAFPPNQMEKWLKIYSHRFINPVFRSFQAELEVVYEEKNLYDDMFQTKLIDKFLNNFYKKHPYGQQTIIGTKENLKNPSLSKMYDFFRTYYVANNMALIISGDFNTEEIVPIIEDEFGKLKKGIIPESLIFNEDPFDGREYVQTRLAPIRLALFGYRSVPNGHPDQIGMQVLVEILSNENGTGLFDQLVIDNKLMFAAIMNAPFNDYGAAIIFVVPKIVGQKIVKTEEMVLEQLKKLKNGEFEDEHVEAIKRNLIKNHILSMESNKSRAMMLMESFVLEKNYKEIEKYVQKVENIKKNDIVELAHKYFGDNYLALYSKMGFGFLKNDKIDKPGYEPLVLNTTSKSKFTKELENVEVNTQEYKVIDFEKDIERIQVQDGVDLFYTNNPLNEIFTLEIKYGVGNEKLPLLKHASFLMNMAGTKDTSVNDFKIEFSKLGCTYYISSDDNYLVISIEGFEENLKEALILINDLFTNPNIEEDKINVILNGERADRKIEKSEPDKIAKALFDYIRYKNRSDYLTRLEMKEVKNLTVLDLLDEFKKAINYEVEIHYVGKYTSQKVSDLIGNSLEFKKTPIKSESPNYKNVEEYSENVIFFVNKKKAIQSKIYLMVNGDEFKTDQNPYYEAFNLYFGGSFSGLVLQEIREYRSLAYSAGANYRTPDLKGGKSYFMGYMGTQDDKTMEAFFVFDSLLKDMPEKSERIEMIKSYLIQSAITKRPSFRNMSQSIVDWKNKGFVEDPNLETIKIADKMLFNDIVEFYEKNLKNRPVIYAVVGDKKRIDLNELSKFGKIIEIKEKDIFND